MNHHMMHQSGWSLCVRLYVKGPQLNATACDREASKCHKVRSVSISVDNLQTRKYWSHRSPLRGQQFPNVAALSTSWTNPQSNVAPTAGFKEA